jgi:hypothetical protein
MPVEVRNAGEGAAPGVSIPRCAGEMRLAADDRPFLSVN